MEATGNCRFHAPLDNFGNVDTVLVMGNTVPNGTDFPGFPQRRMHRNDYGAYNSCRADSTRSRNWRSRCSCLCTLSTL